MELFLEVNTLLIDAAKSGIAEDQYDNPDELIYCFGEKNLIYSYLNPLFYHLDNCRSIFHYLDGIEQIIPKEE